MDPQDKMSVFTQAYYANYAMCPPQVHFFLSEISLHRYIFLFQRLVSHGYSYNGVMVFVF